MELTKIYGITFDESIPTGSDRRVADAEGLSNDFVIGNTFQNGGKNDFDDCYPFGAIRLCNVCYENGKRKITYENEPDFCRSGKNGNVMVEIPRFYSKREKAGSQETWLISGTCHPGFALEPVFTRGAKELDRIYVGVYNSQALPGGIFSSTGGFPDVCKLPDVFCTEFTQAGYDPYDLAVLLCLQKLICIEFGTRYVKQYLGGIGFLRYMVKVNATKEIKEMGSNRVTINKIDRGSYFAPGHSIGLGHQEDVIGYQPTITRIEDHPNNPEWVDIYYDGEDLRGKVNPHKDAAYGVPQRNGISDTLPYHTGRCDLHSMDKSADYLINPFRYRFIENVWGNVWEFTEGLKIHGLQYRYTFDPELYDQSTQKWKSVSYKAPLQHYLTMKATDLWTDQMGMDEKETLLLLPYHSTGNDSLIGQYYDSAVYTYWDRDYSDKPVDPDFTYRFVTGGGFDHSYFGSLFTYRGFMTDTTCEWLNSSRVCLRR